MHGRRCKHEGGTFLARFVSNGQVCLISPCQFRQLLICYWLLSLLPFAGISERRLRAEPGKIVMMISRFNRFFARHGRAAFLIIGIMIIIPFVFLGPWGRSGGGRQTKDGRPEVGTMYGKPLDSKEFRQKLQAADVATFLRWGRFLSQDDRMFGFLVMETLKRIRALREVRARGLDNVGDDEVAEVIGDHWLFQTDGKLDREKFIQFKENALSRRGIDGHGFDEIVRENIMIERLEAQVRASVFVSPQEVREEYGRKNESFKISYCDFKYHELLKAPSLDPSKEALEAYFSAHREDLRLEPQKRIRIVELTSESFLDQIEIPESDIEGYYKRNKKRLYDPKKKTYESVKDEITTRLKRSKSRTKSGAVAKEMVEKLRKAIADGGNTKSAADLLAEFSKADGLTAKDSGPFNAESEEIPEIGKHRRLRDTGARLSEDKPVADAVYDGGNYFVAVLLEMIDGELAKELSEVEETVKEMVIAAEARKFYEEHVETYRARLVDGKLPENLKEDYAAEVKDMEDKTDEEREALIEAFNKDVTTYLTAYFVPEQRKVRAVVFSTADQRSKVKVTDGDIQAYYDEHTADYSKEEVKARQILVRVPPNAEDEEKDKQKKKLDGLLAELREGKDFAQLARVHSDDSATKRKGGDLGYFDRNGKDSALAAAAFSLDLGEISSVIETGQGLVLLKLEGKRQGRVLAEVRGEIRRKIVDEKAERQAEEAAVAFSDEAYAALGGDGTTKMSAVELFSQLATVAQLKVQDSDWFRGMGSIPPFGFERDLSKKAFALCEANPLSEAVKGRNKFYVACWLDNKPAYLPAFADEKNLSKRVENHMKREAAQKLARKNASDAYERIKAALTEKKTFLDAAGDAKVETPDSFTQSDPLTGVSESRKIMELLSEKTPGALLEPVETNTGAVLAYLESRLPADVSEFEAKRESLTEQMKRQKEGQALQGFYSRLEEESDTTMSKEWGGKDDEDEE